MFLYPQPDCPPAPTASSPNRKVLRVGRALQFSGGGERRIGWRPTVAQTTR